MPVIIEKSQDKDEVISKDPTIKEMDLAAISEKEVFVRKANIVTTIFFILTFKCRMTSRRVLIIVSLQCI